MSVFQEVRPDSLLCLRTGGGKEGFLLQIVVAAWENAMRCLTSHDGKACLTLFVLLEGSLAHMFTRG